MIFAEGELVNVNRNIIRTQDLFQTRLMSMASLYLCQFVEALLMYNSVFLEFKDSSLDFMMFSGSPCNVCGIFS